MPRRFIRRFGYPIPGLLVTPREPKIIGSPSSSTERLTVRDTIFDERTFTGAESGTQFTISNPIPEASVALFHSQNPSVCKVSQSGDTEFVSEGTGKINVILRFDNGLLAQSAVLAPCVITTGTAIEREFVSWVDGSLVKHITDSVSSVLGTGPTPSTQLLFTTVNHGSGVYVRNTSCPVYDFTGPQVASVWNNLTTDFRSPITAIGNRYALCSTHVSPHVNNVVRWVAIDNTVVERTIISKRNVGFDKSVFLLSSALPASIGFAKVLPTNFENYAAAIAPLKASVDISSIGHQIPTVSLGQFGDVFTRDAYNFVSYSFSLRESNWVPAWTREVVSRDSSHPCFLPINGELVLAILWTSGGGGVSPGVSEIATAINNGMASMAAEQGAPVETLTTVDLSGFPDY